MLEQGQLYSFIGTKNYFKWSSIFRNVVLTDAIASYIPEVTKYDWGTPGRSAEI